jgi:hypothetical protein
MIAANDDDLPDDDLLAELPTLGAVSRFARMVRNVSWFAAVGEPLGPAEIADAEAYLAALGFPDAHVAAVGDWHEAEACARNPDWNSAWWEAEEQLRAALVAAAAERVGERELLVALTHVTNQASDVVHGAAAVAAARGGVADMALIRAAAGAATQACYQAALVLAAGAEAEHPFAIKFRLYEAGRWPLGIVGMTFNVF